MTYRILKFNVTLVGEKKSGKSFLFPIIDGTNTSTRLEIISDVEADTDILLTDFHLPIEQKAAKAHTMVSDGIVGVFDVTAEVSFETLRDFLLSVESTNQAKGTVLVIGHDRGNSPRAIFGDTLNDFANRIGATYLETSSKFVKGLDIMMRRFAGNLIRNTGM